MEQLGAEIRIIESRDGYGPTHFLIKGVNMQPTPPSSAIDCGNSGTGMRLMAGMLAACPFDSELFGDASLCSRPMGRIMTPLAQMGASIEAVGEKPGCAPLKIKGGTLHPISYTLPMASAQVKSAVLLAGMFANGTTSVVQPAQTRDHTERLFHHFGIPCSVDGLSVSMVGPASPVANNLTVPADISSAAFWIVAAATRPGSSLVLKNVGLNPTRDAILHALRRMGASISVTVTSPEGAGEPYGDLHITGDAPLHGTTILKEEIPNLIDEIPIIAVAAALAEGDTVIRNAHELRVKETDRIATTATNLRAMGADVEEFDDGMIIHGGKALSGCTLESYGDHRIAMASLIAGMSASGETVLNNCNCISTSYPGFAEDLAHFVND
jgi:3-phosphoshikimate 1-carboxyvinyltransferase